MRGVLDVGDFIPKARRRLRLLNTALHLAELVRLLAVFPRMMQSIILQRQFELIHLVSAPKPLSVQCPQPKGHGLHKSVAIRLLTVSASLPQRVKLQREAYAC